MGVWTPLYFLFACLTRSHHHTHHTDTQTFYLKRNQFTVQFVIFSKWTVVSCKYGVMMQNGLNEHPWRWSDLRAVFEYSLYMTQQNLVAFSTPYACHTSTYESARADLMIRVLHNIKVFIFVDCCNEGKHYTVNTVSDVAWSKGHKEFPFSGSPREYL